MTLKEKTVATRALADELFKGPCDFEKTFGPCLENVRKEATVKQNKTGKATLFNRYDSSNFCTSCASYWHVEVAAQDLEIALRYEEQRK